MAKQYPGHIRLNGEMPEEQALADHCRNTAAYAAQCLQELGLAHTATLAGLLHDAGKARDAFRDYLERAVIRGEAVQRGSVNHSFAACRYLLEQYHNSEELGIQELTAELLAYACGAHHGLFDCIDGKQQRGFAYRLKEGQIDYENTMEHFFAQCISQEEVKRLFQAAQGELTPIIEGIITISEENRNPDHSEGESRFYIGMLERLLLSAVIEGDRRDTAEFMNQVSYPSFPTGEERRKKWRECLDYMEQKLEKFPQDTPIQKARRKISDKCAQFARHEGGVIRLNVPTGGGKTLASLRFALAHAEQWNKSRIILTSSLLSVLDQNAQVIRDFLPDPGMILEHHSNVVQSDDELWEQMVQQWSSPVIITTLVQLLNTLFSGRGSCIRRFHALANAVLVIDEVQTVPNNLLTLFNLAVNFLTEVCGATVVLCSATQPCLECAEHPLLRTPADMVPFDEKLWAVFIRTEIRDAGFLCQEELPALVKSVLEQTDSLLVVCNTKKEAEKLFRSLELPHTACFHLSAAMCMAHRQEVLKRINEELAQKQRKVVCISTQVIEAGVDISFGCVIRLAAGMDSVVQSAGRCNRNGENPQPAPVYIVRCVDENLKMLADIQRSQKATVALLDYFSKSPQALDHNLASDRAICFYYKQLYRSLNLHYQDDLVQGCSVYDLLGSNETYADGNCPYSDQYFLQQAFQTAGKLFTVFQQDTWEVVVPYGAGLQLRTRLIAMSKESTWDYQEIEKLVRQARAYTVSLYAYQKQELERRGAWTELFGGRICVLTDGFYDPETGFTMEQSNWEV